MTRYYLIVDDDEVCRKLLRQCLRQILGSPGVDAESPPFVIHTAKDGVEALHKMVSFLPRKYDLVITDYSMPGVDGHVTAKLLRIIDDQVPIACVTSETLDAKFLSGCRDAGIHTVCEKPINGSKVLAILLESVSRSSLTQELPSISHAAQPMSLALPLLEEAASISSP